MGPSYSQQSHQSLHLLPAEWPWACTSAPLQSSPTWGGNNNTPPCLLPSPCSCPWPGTIQLWSREIERRKGSGPGFYSGSTICQLCDLGQVNNLSESTIHPSLISCRKIFQKGKAFPEHSELWTSSPILASIMLGNYLSRNFLDGMSLADNTSGLFFIFFQTTPPGGLSAQEP